MGTSFSIHRARRAWILTLALVCHVACSPPPVTTDASDDGSRMDAADTTVADGNDVVADMTNTCHADPDCSDTVFCNGAERCMPGAAGADARGCVAANPATPCATGQMCDEANDRCQTACDMGADADGDGHNAASCGGDDCDDADPNRFPGNTETCDSMDHDEDCDTMTFGVRDADGDGTTDIACCNGTGATQRCGTDCDDRNSSIHPTATETCNGVDDNCDGTADEGVIVTFYADCDGDGHGQLPTAAPACMRPGSAMGCVAPTGYVPSMDDCDDGDSRRFPGNFETCDGIDNDCNSIADNGAPAPRSYRDHDGDGYVDATMSSTTCPVPSEYIVPSPARDPSINPAQSDCNDNNGTIHPEQMDTCTIDRDCVPGISVTTVTWYADCDGDGYAPLGAGTFTGCDPPSSPPTCTAPATLCSTALSPSWENGHRPDAMFPASIDCDDYHPSVHPGASEACDGLDTDCNGTADWVEGTSREDNDGDGFPGTTCMRLLCASAIDCNDTSASIHPGAMEVVADGIDESCDGLETCYLDSDGDGYRGTMTTVTNDVICYVFNGHYRESSPLDCCDSDYAANPGLAPDAWFTTATACGGFDYDCSGGEDAEYTDLTSGGACTVAGGGCGANPRIPGWTTSVPACGASGTFRTGCFAPDPPLCCEDATCPSGISCAPRCTGGSSSTVAQGCH